MKIKFCVLLFILFIATGCVETRMWVQVKVDELFGNTIGDEDITEMTLPTDQTLYSHNGAMTLMISNFTTQYVMPHALDAVSVSNQTWLDIDFARKLRSEHIISTVRLHLENAPRIVHRVAPEKQNPDSVILWQMRLLPPTVDTPLWVSNAIRIRKDD